MENILTTLPNTFLGWAGILALVIFGIFAIVGLFDKRAKERKKDADVSEDRLIDILKKTVDQLEIKVTQQTKDIEKLTDEVHELKRDNEKYIEIFKGRDQTTQEFYKQGFEAMKVAQQTHDLVTTMATSIKDTNTAMNKLIGVLEKSIEANKKA